METIKYDSDPLQNSNKLNAELLVELKSHKKSKTCDQCDFKCMTNPELRRHTQIKHEGLRFNCDQCDSVHQYEQGLSNHKRSIHEGVRYSCPECDSKFSRPRTLRNHIRSLHEGKLYNCDQCDYKAAPEGPCQKGCS